MQGGALKSWRPRGRGAAQARGKGGRTAPGAPAEGRRREGGKETAVEDAAEGNFGAKGARERGSGAPRSVGGKGEPGLSPFCRRDAITASKNFEAVLKRVYLSIQSKIAPPLRLPFGAQAARPGAELSFCERG